MLGAFIGALTRSLRWRPKRQLGLRSVEDARVGAVIFVQRSDSASRLDVHLHTLALDGVYDCGEDGELDLRVPTSTSSAASGSEPGSSRSKRRRVGAPRSGLVCPAERSPPRGCPRSRT